MHANYTSFLLTSPVFQQESTTLVKSKRTDINCILIQFIFLWLKFADVTKIGYSTIILEILETNSGFHVK